MTALLTINQIKFHSGLLQTQRTQTYRGPLVNSPFDKVSDHFPQLMFLLFLCVCWQVFCGRYVNEHMVTHGAVSEHPVVLSFSDLSVWCYLCEAYVHNQVSVCE